MAITRGGVGLGMRVVSGTTCGAAAVSVMARRPASEFARESFGILGSYPATFQVADDDDPTGRIGAARHQRCIHGPTTGGLPEFKLFMLPLREQARCTAFPQKRKTLPEQRLEGRHRARGDGIRMAFEARRKILDALGMHARRRTCQASSLAQECGLFRIAFNEVDGRPRTPCKRAGEHEAGESAA